MNQRRAKPADYEINALTPENTNGGLFTVPFNISGIEFRIGLWTQEHALQVDGPLLAFQFFAIIAKMPEGWEVCAHSVTWFDNPETEVVEPLQQTAEFNDIEFHLRWMLSDLHAKLIIWLDKQDLESDMLLTQYEQLLGMIRDRLVVVGTEFQLR